mmetsp:Transcript_12345/g.37173  ORF Transcript_12345/g.37173 Transcript_12345/m.37173 type:complete len:151 (+) Transcript_12345:2976-3428(+)
MRLVQQRQQDAAMRSGEAVAPLAARLASLPGVTAVLLNCSAPQAISAALPQLRAAVPAGVRVGAYGNGFRSTTSEWLARQGGGASSFTVPKLHRDPGDYDDGGMITSEAYVRYAREWVAAGASIVGGCCGIGPAHMKAVREAFQAADAGQ